MPYPTKYTRQYGFQAYQDANPNRPLPGDKVDYDLNVVALSSDEVVEFLKLHSRSDGALLNGVVTMDSLGADVLSAIALGDANALASAVVVTPVGGITATNVQDALEDLDAALAGAGAVGSVFGRTGAITATAGDYTAAQVTNTPAGNIAATTVQAAINELDTEKLASASYTAADVLAKLLTVDGAGSGLDADTLDGQSSAAFQPVDADLTALAALAATAGMVSRTGASAFAVRTITAPAAGITVSNGTGAAGDPTLALANDLAALEALASTGIAVRTGTDTWAQRSVAVTAANGGIAVANGNGVSGNPTLNLHAMLENLASLTTAADRGVYWTALNTSALFTFTSFGRSLVDDADATAARSTLGLVIGTNVQAYDAELAALAGLTSAADALPYFTGSGTAAVTTLTSAARGLLDDTTTAAMRTTLSVRELLTADRTYYVRTDGSDSNDGLTNSSGGAFLTIQKAIDVAYGLDFGVYNVTISVQSGTYTAGATFTGRHTGAGALTLAGASATISTTSAACITASLGAVVTVSGFTVQTTTSGNCFSISKGAVVNLGTGMTFAACAGDHISVSDYGQMVGNTYTISGGASRHIIITGGSVSFGASTTTLTGTPAFSQFILAQNLGVASFFTTVFSGAATGTRYSASLNAAINTFGGGASYFPGSVAGSTGTGGQYA